MKKLYPLLSVLFLIYWGCDDFFDPSVNLWGVDYSIENTTELYLLNSGLTGEIPVSICDLNINWSNTHDLNLSDNQLCPPYPSCIEDYVGEQDTSNCGD